VTLGEADAGVVYRTDARAAGDKVNVVPLPPTAQVMAEYPVAIVRAISAAERARATQFRDLLLSTTGQRALTARGFLLPAQTP
jgi:molybdate transport system substrate-binding protein